MSMIRRKSTSALPFRRYFRFLTVGLFNALVDLVVLNTLLVLRPTHSAAMLSIYNTLAVVAAVMNSYLWNSRWTFRDLVDSSSRQRVLFWLQAGLNVILNDLITVWVSLYLTSVKSLPLFIGSNLAKALAMFLSSSASYVLMRVLIFPNPRNHCAKSEQKPVHDFYICPHVDEV